MDNPNYKVESKEEKTRLNTKTGDIDTYYIVYAESRGGTKFHLDIAESELSKADKLLETRAKALDAI